MQRAVKKYSVERKGLVSAYVTVPGTVALTMRAAIVHASAAMRGTGEKSGFVR